VLFPPSLNFTISEDCTQHARRNARCNLDADRRQQPPLPLAAATAAAATAAEAPEDHA